MKKNVLIGLLVVFLIFLVAVVYIYNKPHRDVVDEKATYSLTLEQIQNEFSENEAEASKKYFNQVVELSGKLTSLNDGGNGRYDFVITSNGKVANGEIVQISPDQKELIEKEVLVKGLFIGYDDLLEEIQLSECTLKEK